MDQYKNLVLFSTEYPYETTLKNEFKVLSEHFNQIYYIPSTINTPFVNTDFPSNVVPIALFDKTLNNPYKLYRKHFFHATMLYLKEMLMSKKPFKYIKGFRTYLSIAAINIEKKDILSQFVLKGNLCENTIFYDYWFENSTLAIALLKKQKLIKKAICRTHRFDLYDDAWNGQPVPFRNFKIQHLDGVFAIAKHGQEYLKSVVKEKYHKKIWLHYLGIEQPDYSVVPETTNAQKIIVSISNTRPFKRVHIIPDVLMHIKNRVKWIHFGEGPMDCETKDKFNKLPDNITVEWKGRVPNTTVIEYYKNAHIDLFLSLSISEGLPISMMEAISFGVPVFAANVCGIPELVNNTTGVLFEKNDSIIEIANKLEYALKINFDKGAIRKFSKTNFDYKTNYIKFIHQIKS